MARSISRLPAQKGILIVVRVDQSKHFVLCDCGSEGIMIQHDEVFGDTYLSIFSEGYRGAPWSMSWKERFRSMWHILKTGSAYGDQIILDKVSRFALIDALKAWELIDARAETTTDSTEAI